MRVLALLAAVFAVSCEEGRRDRPTVSPEIAEKYAREAYNAQRADLPAGNSADTPQGYFARVGRDFDRQGMNVALDAKGDTLTLVTSGSDDLGMEQCSLLKNSFRPGRSHDVVSTGRRSSAATRATSCTGGSRGLDRRADCYLLRPLDRGVEFARLDRSGAWTCRPGLPPRGHSRSR